MSHTQLVAITLIAMTLVIAGCGGGSKSASLSGGSNNAASATDAASATSSGSSDAATVPGGGPGKTLSRSQLIAAADAICAKLNTALVAAKDTIHTKADIVRVARRRAPAERSTVAELSKLTPPSSLTHDWRQILAARRLLVEEIDQAGEDAKTNNMEGVHRALVAATSVQGQMSTTARRDGFKDCSEVG